MQPVRARALTVAPRRDTQARRCRRRSPTAGRCRRRLPTWRPSPPWRVPHTTFIGWHCTTCERSGRWGPGRARVLQARQLARPGAARPRRLKGSPLRSGPPRTRAVATRANAAAAADAASTPRPQLRLLDLLARDGRQALVPLPERLGGDRRRRAGQPGRVPASGVGRRGAPVHGARGRTHASAWGAWVRACAWHASIRMARARARRPHACVRTHTGMHVHMCACMCTRARATWDLRLRAAPNHATHARMRPPTPRPSSS